MAVSIAVIVVVTRSFAETAIAISSGVRAPWFSATPVGFDGVGWVFWSSQCWVELRLA